MTDQNIADTWTRGHLSDLPAQATEAEKADIIRGINILEGLAASLPPLAPGVSIPIPMVSGGEEQ